jgi:hypothetical protein
MARALMTGWLGLRGDGAAVSGREPARPRDARYRLQAVRVERAGGTLPGEPHRDERVVDAVGFREPPKNAAVLIVYVLAECSTGCPAGCLHGSAW